MRTTNHQGTCVYRALVVVRYEYEDGSDPVEHVSAYGPYATKAPAKRALSAETHPKRNHGAGVTREATGHTEASPLVWLPVE